MDVFLAPSPPSHTRAFLLSLIQSLFKPMGIWIKPIVNILKVNQILKCLSWREIPIFDKTGICKSLIDSGPGETATLQFPQNARSCTNL